MEPIHEFTIRNTDELYDKVQDIEWHRYMHVDGTLAIDCVSRSELFRHNKYAALVTKDAIVDQFRDRFKRRPSVDVEAPDLRVHLHINDDKATILRDCSGDGLHRRGYRIEGGAAPLNEVLAAGMIRLSGYDGSVPFIDFMCGSGTLVIEAAAVAGKRASQRLRREFGFSRWPDFDEKLWARVKADTKAREVDPPKPILGSDYDREALNNAHLNLEAAQLSSYTSLRLRDFMQLPPPPPAPGIVMINPPYDKRIKDEDVNKLYTKIGDTLKQRYTGYTAFIFTGNMEALKHVGLKTTQRIPLYNGPLEARLVKYELF